MTNILLELKNHVKEDIRNFTNFKKENKTRELLRGAIEIISMLALVTFGGACLVFCGVSNPPLFSGIPIFSLGMVSIFLGAVIYAIQDQRHDRWLEEHNLPKRIRFFF
jgi:hypothetical protein